MNRFMGFQNLHEGVQRFDGFGAIKGFFLGGEGQREGMGERRRGGIFFGGGIRDVSGPGVPFTSFPGVRCRGGRWRVFVEHRARTGRIRGLMFNRRKRWRGLEIGFNVRHWRRGRREIRLRPSVGHLIGGRVGRLRGR